MRAAGVHNGCVVPPGAEPEYRANRGVNGEPVESSKRRTRGQVAERHLLYCRALFDRGETGRWWL